MQKQKVYVKGEKIGCFEIVGRKEEENTEGASTRGNYSIWICKCTHTKNTCAAWKQKCQKVERTTKQLDQNKPPERCKDGRLVALPKASTGVQTATPSQSGNTSKKCFEGSLESVIVFDPESLKKQIRKYYVAHLKVDKIKPLFEDMYDDLYVNSLVPYGFETQIKNKKITQTD